MYLDESARASSLFKTTQHRSVTQAKRSFRIAEQGTMLLKQRRIKRRHSAIGVIHEIEYLPQLRRKLCGSFPLLRAAPRREDRHDDEARRHAGSEQGPARIEGC